MLLAIHKQAHVLLLDILLLISRTAVDWFSNERSSLPHPR